MKVSDAPTHSPHMFLTCRNESQFQSESSGERNVQDSMNVHVPLLRITHLKDFFCGFYNKMLMSHCSGSLTWKISFVDFVTNCWCSLAQDHSLERLFCGYFATCLLAPNCSHPQSLPNHRSTVSNHRQQLVIYSAYVQPYWQFFLLPWME
jgi:hypothetical protein